MCPNLVSNQGESGRTVARSVRSTPPPRTTISEQAVYGGRLVRPCVAKIVSQNRHRCSIGGHPLCRRFSSRLLTTAAAHARRVRIASTLTATRSPPRSLRQRALRRGGISAGYWPAFRIRRLASELRRCGAYASVVIAARESDPRAGSTGRHPLWGRPSSRDLMPFMFMTQRR